MYYKKTGAEQLSAGPLILCLNAVLDQSVFNTTANTAVSTKLDTITP